MNWPVFVGFAVRTDRSVGAWRFFQFSSDFVYLDRAC
jgi:hypothetical protein